MEDVNLELGHPCMWDHGRLRKNTHRQIHALGLRATGSALWFSVLLPLVSDSDHACVKTSGWQVGSFQRDMVGEKGKPQNSREFNRNLIPHQLNPSLG